MTGTVAYDVVSHIATFAPVSALAANTFYSATITTGAKDLSGNALASDAVWNFTTATSATGQGQVVLGAAGNFAVLAGSTVTSTWSYNGQWRSWGKSGYCSDWIFCG